MVRKSELSKDVARVAADEISGRDCGSLAGMAVRIG